MAWKRLVAVWLLTTSALAGAQEPSIPVAELFPLEQRSKPFVVTEGPEKGSRVQVTLTPLPEATDVWRLRMPSIGDVHLTQGPDGALLIQRIDIAAQHRRIIYDEPVRLLPAEVAPDERFSTRTSAQVIDTQTGEVLRGTVDHTVEPASRETYRLPAGKMEAFTVTAQQHIDLGNASVDLRLEGGLARNQGVIYGNVRYEIDKPLWFGSTSRHTVELAEETQTASR